MKSGLIIILLTACVQVIAKPTNYLIYNGNKLKLDGDIFSDMQLPTSNPLYNLFKNDSTCIYYETTWEVIDQKLYLVEIKKFCEPNHEIVDLSQLFTNGQVNGKIYADWVTGEVFGYLGKAIDYWEGQYAEVYEAELGLEFLAGQLVGTKTYDNSRSKFTEYYHDYSKLHKFVNGRLHREQFKQVKDLEKSQFHGILKTDSTGQILSVEVFQGFGEPYDTEIKKAIMLLGQWAVTYKHGKYVDKDYWISIFIRKIDMILWTVQGFRTYYFMQNQPDISNVSGTYKLNYAFIPTENRKDVRRKKPEIVLSKNGTFEIRRIPCFDSNQILTHNYNDELSIKGNWAIKKFEPADSINGNTHPRWGLLLDSVPEKMKYIEIIGKNRPQQLDILIDRQWSDALETLNFKKKK